MRTKIIRSDMPWTYCVLIGLAVVCCDLTAQTPDSFPRSEILLTGFSTNDEIVLRWAPSTPGAWALSNKSGYIIERAEFDTTSTYDPDQMSRLTPDTLKPWPLEEWEPIANEASGDKYAAIAAQSIYGESFYWSENNSNSNSNSNDDDLIGRADAFKTRYSVALLAADISENAAEASALRYVDRDVTPGKMYLYRVSSLATTPGYPIDTGYYAILCTDQPPAPAPELRTILELEKMVQLKWDREMHRQLYSAYYIERSENGTDFTRLNTTPFVSSPKLQDKESFQDYVFTDSLGTNYRKYYYRIVGITPFGSESTPSNVLSGMGRDRTPPPTPTDVTADHIPGEGMVVTWNIKDDLPGDIAGFYVAHSHEVMNNFTPVNTDLLPPDQRTYTHTGVNTRVPNFYAVAAVDTSGNGAVSLSSYGNAVDTFPPEPPTGLTGTIDSNGVVHLTWNRNAEDDIMGYQIYFANSNDHVFTQVTSRPWTDTMYVDTINIGTLTRYAYYKVVAVDAYFNYSQRSEPFRVTRPDTIPPSSPILVGYNVAPDGINVSWANSSDMDVAETRLHRRASDEEWDILQRFYDGERSFTDTAVVAAKTYEYMIDCVDSSGHISSSIYTIRVAAYSTAVAGAIQSVDLRQTSDGDVLIDWQYNEAAIEKFIIYRSENNGPYKALAHVTTGTTFVDTEVRKNVTYGYSITAILSDGRQSEFSQEKEIVVQ